MPVDPKIICSILALIVPAVLSALGFTVKLGVDQYNAQHIHQQTDRQTEYARQQTEYARQQTEFMAKDHAINLERALRERGAASTNGPFEFKPEIQEPKSSPIVADKPKPSPVSEFLPTLSTHIVPPGPGRATTLAFTNTDGKDISISGFIFTDYKTVWVPPERRSFVSVGDADLIIERNYYTKQKDHYEGIFTPPIAVENGSTKRLKFGLFIPGHPGLALRGRMKLLRKDGMVITFDDVEMDMVEKPAR